jgi:hypothetical protein
LVYIFSLLLVKLVVQFVVQELDQTEKAAFSAEGRRHVFQIQVRKGVWVLQLAAARKSLLTFATLLTLTTLPTFATQSGVRSWLLQAETAADMAHWLSLIRQAVDSTDHLHADQPGTISGWMGSSSRSVLEDGSVDRKQSALKQSALKRSALIASHCGTTRNRSSLYQLDMEADMEADTSELDTTDTVSREPLHDETYHSNMEGSGSDDEDEVG